MELPLKFTWSISRNSSDIKRNFIVKVKNGSIEAYGEVAFNVRYGESRELIIEKFEEFKNNAPRILTVWRVWSLVWRALTFPNP
ncbi:MAG: hypothetical protein QM760_14985 [Nibricoccus sp.]